MKSTDFAMAVYTVKAAIGADPAPHSSQATRETFNSPWLHPFLIFVYKLSTLENRRACCVYP